MRPFRSRIAIALVLFVISALAGWWVTRSLPQRLKIEFEQRLSASLQTSVSLDQLQVAPRSFIQVDALGVRAWPHPDGAGLEIQKVSSSLDALSLLVGRIRLREVLIDGLRLRVTAVDGEAQSDLPSDPATPAEVATSQPDDLLSSLAILEATARGLLEAPTLAFSIKVEDAVVEFPSAESSTTAAFELRGISGALVHSRIGNTREFSVQGRLFASERDLGPVDLTGRRDSSGLIRIAVATPSLQLGAGISSWYGQAPDSGLDGILSGELSYETDQPGIGRFAINVAARDLRGTLPPPGADTPRKINLSGIAASAVLDITPQRAVVQSGRIASQKTTVQISATLARPLQGNSWAELSLQFRNIDVSQLRRGIGWLPEIEREEAAAIVAPIQSGRLVEMKASGAATLSEWQDFLAGRTRARPDAFLIDAELEDTTVWVGDSDRVEDLRARIRWNGSRVEVSEASALLNGEPLPALALVVEGFPNFFTSDPAARVLRSGAEPLTGLAVLWETLLSPTSEEPSGGTRIEIELDFLDHPMFLWPIRDLTLALETGTDGIHIVPVSGSWAGVPIHGEIDWIFRPEQKVYVRLAAKRATTSDEEVIVSDEQETVSAEQGEPRLAEPAPVDKAIPENDWARGRFRVGPIEGERWRQSDAAGYFEATANRIQIRKLAIDLIPTGTLDGVGMLDLSKIDTVPFHVDFNLRGGDADATANVVGLPPNLIQGDVDMVGKFQGTLRPGTRLVLGLTGSLEIAATDGMVRRSVPPVGDVAQANRTLAELDPSEVLPYDRIDTVLEFSNGQLQTESLFLDGANLGVLASGSVDLASDTKEVDGQVAFFLFRKLDRVLEKIPILNLILLGTDDNLIASYYRVTGPWRKPKTKSILLPGSAGPAIMVLQGVPMFMMRAIQAIRSVLSPDPPEPAPSPNSGGENREQEATVPAD